MHQSSQLRHRDSIDSSGTREVGGDTAKSAVQTPTVVAAEDIGAQVAHPQFPGVEFDDSRSRCWRSRLSHSKRGAREMSAGPQLQQGILVPAARYPAGDTTAGCEELGFTSWFRRVSDASSERTSKCRMQLLRDSAMHRETCRSTECGPLANAASERSDGSPADSPALPRPKTTSNGSETPCNSAVTVCSCTCPRGAGRRKSNPGSGHIEVDLEPVLPSPTPGVPMPRALRYIQQPRHLRFAL